MGPHVDFCVTKPQLAKYFNLRLIWQTSQQILDHLHIKEIQDQLQRSFGVIYLSTFTILTFTHF